MTFMGFCADCESTCLLDRHGYCALCGSSSTVSRAGNGGIIDKVARAVVQSTVGEGGGGPTMAKSKDRGPKDTDAATVSRGESGSVVARGHHYTLGEVSRGSGVSRPHVTRIFNGKRGLSLDAARRISGFLGVPIESLLGLLNRG